MTTETATAPATPPAKKPKVLIFEATDTREKIFQYYSEVTPILNAVRVEFLELGIGVFDLLDVIRFTEAGPELVINRFREAFDQAISKMPKIIYGALNELPTDKIARQFQVHYTRLCTIRDNYAQNETLLNRRLINECVNLRQFLELAESGEVILPEKSRKTISEKCKFYAETDDEGRLFEIGQQIQSLFTEAHAIWQRAELKPADMVSLPGDRFTGVFNIDIDSTLTFNPESVRVIRL